MAKPFSGGIRAAAPSPPRSPGTREPGDLRIPIVQEEAHLTKRSFEADRMRVRTLVEAREELVEDNLILETLEVERRPVDRPVDSAPPPREEGDATIFSVVEERLVVTTQLHVVEEVIVRRVATRTPVAAPVTLRATRVVVERDPVTQEEDH